MVLKPAMLLILIGLYSLVLGAFVWTLNESLDKPEVVEQTKVEYVDREITKRDTVTIDRPVTRTIYRRTTDTVVVRVPIPMDFDLAGLIHPTPIKIDGRRVTLTYFSPDSLRFIQDVYETKKRRWGLWLDSGGKCSPIYGCSIDARVNGRYGAVRAFGGYSISEVGHGLLFGARLRIVGWE